LRCELWHFAEKGTAPRTQDESWPRPFRREPDPPRSNPRF
jgi:hypothetical protein